MSWLKTNLFGSKKDAVLTVVLGSLLLAIVYAATKFVFFGADWKVVRLFLRQFMVGGYTQGQEYRLVAVLVALAITFGGTAGVWEARRGASGLAVDSQSEFNKSYPKRFGLLIGLGLVLAWAANTIWPWIIVLVVSATPLVSKLLFVWLGRRYPSKRFYTWTPIALFVLLLGVSYWALQALDDLDDLGGFFLNVGVAVAATLACLPVGILLALGRRSKMYIISALCVGLIEIVRGGPLFVWLYLGGQLVPFFLPSDSEVTAVTLSFIIFTIFTGAYMAEIIRGGLQSIDKGQSEAAQALGLKPFNQTRLIVLPQAMRNVIPAQIGQLISLFKDTVLAGIALGLLEVLSVGGVSVSQAIFRGDRPRLEMYLFVGLLFWVLAYTTSRESQRFEKKLGIG